MKVGYIPDAISWRHHSGVARIWYEWGGFKRK